MQACFQQVKTIYVPKKVNIVPPTGNETEIITTTMAATMSMMNDTEAAMRRSLQFQDGMNVLGVFEMKFT